MIGLGFRFRYTPSIVPRLHTIISRYTWVGTLDRRMEFSLSPSLGRLPAAEDAECNIECFTSCFTLLAKRSFQHRIVIIMIIIIIIQKRFLTCTQSFTYLYYTQCVYSKVCIHIIYTYLFHLHPPISSQTSSLNFSPAYIISSLLYY